MAQTIERVLALLSRLLIYAAAFFLTAMMLHVFTDVVLKYLMNQPIPGTDEIVARYYMVAAVFLPLPFVEIRNSGISVDLFYNMFGPAVRRAMLLFAYVGQVIFFTLLAYQSSFDAWQSFSIREYVSAQIIVTVWPASFFLPIGFGIAALVSILRIFQVLTRDDWELVCGYATDVEPDRPAKESL